MSVCVVKVAEQIPLILVQKLSSTYTLGKFSILKKAYFLITNS